MANTQKTYWIELGFLPAHVGFCPSKKAWKCTFKELKQKPHEWPRSDGSCTRIYNDLGHPVILITISGKAAKRVTGVQIVGIVAHEAMHAWRFIRDHIGESEPSFEFEAYVIQAITMGLLTGYKQSNKIDV